MKQGWKPLRTIVFASWDGEEYGLIGSTEWVEEYLPWLSKANVAYLVSLSQRVFRDHASLIPTQNVDVAANGPNFEASASPLLNRVIYEATRSVPSPNQTVRGQTVYDTWDRRIKTMGSGSDFTAFQDFAGVPSLSIEFGQAKGDPVYHYHSNYDSLYWMQKYGDPGFRYHRAMAQLMGLIAGQLADLPLVSFSAVDYADAMRTYIKQVEAKFDAALSPAHTMDATAMSDEAITVLRASHRETSKHGDKTSPDAKSFEKSLDKLYAAAWKLKKAAVYLDARAAELEERVKMHVPWWKWPKWLRLAIEIRKVNTKYKYLERSFLYEEGLDSRPWFKHVVFAPGLWTGYAGGEFSNSWCDFARVIVLTLCSGVSWVGGEY